ncbi:MAG: radical SAM protein [Candidatus Aenigmarchaeota archaeon]|nr:radical SAM protein [Candidatus Aenigmarchaeota archaeon]
MVDERIKRLYEWYKQGRAPPYKIDIEPTAGCNLNCKFCWTREESRVKACNYKRMLDGKTISRIVEEAAELGVKEWQIAGGWEPLIKPRIVMKMMKMIKEYGMYGCITTNGTLFTPKMIKKLVEIGWDQILFSVEGPDSDTHDYLVGKKGAFKKVKRNLLLFKRWKDSYKTTKPKYSIHAVLCNVNYTKLAEMVKFGWEVGCDGVNFEPLIVWGKESESIKLKHEHMRRLKREIKRALKVARVLNVPTNLEWWLNEAFVEKKDMTKIMEKLKKGGGFLNVPCFYPWLGMEIRVSGRVTPCRLCDNEDYCDSVFEKSLKEIWYEGYLKKFRKDMLKWKLASFCSKCASGIVVETLKMRKELMNFIKEKHHGSS